MKPGLATPVARLSQFYAAATEGRPPGREASPFDTPMSRIAAAFIVAAQPDAWFRCDFNGVDAWIPRDTLRTMVHCIHVRENGGIAVRVETGHLAWMMARLEQGGTFVDVGAATGATTLPIAIKFGKKVSVVAFEPATTARRLLGETLERNHLRDVSIVPKAVSSAIGTATFAEYGFDETGAVPFLPEASAILAQNIDRSKARTFEIAVTTLDALLLEGRSPVVVKIDVEGFEIEVLKGAANFIRQYRPFFAVDIHKLPAGGEMTEARVREVLGNHQYSFSKLEHVLLCEPR